MTHTAKMPLSKGEQRRLSADKSDWKLVGGNAPTRTRTRGGGKGRPNLERFTVNSPGVVVVDNNDEMSEESQLTNGSGDPLVLELSEDEETTTPAVVVKKKPPHARVMLEVSQLEEVFRGFPCPKCNGQLELKLRTVCIATNIELICNNKDCSYVSEFARPSPTTIHEAE
jgi:hypothetical protein